MWHKKSREPRTVPGGAPESTEHGLEDASPTITGCFLCIKKDLINLLILPLLPYLISLNRTFLWSMINALLKSNIITYVCCLVSNFCIISCIVIISWLSQKWPLQNTFCSGDKISCFSRLVNTCSQIMCSKVLQHTLVRDIKR